MMDIKTTQAYFISSQYKEVKELLFDLLSKYRHTLYKTSQG